MEVTLSVNSSAREIENALFFNDRFEFNDFVAILRNCKLSRKQKIHFLDSLFVCTERISTSIAQSYEDIFLLLQTVIQTSDLEAIVFRIIRTQPFDDNVKKIVTLVLDLKYVNIHNIMKGCMNYETFKFALEQNYKPESFNYLHSYLVNANSLIIPEMVELMFQISPPDIAKSVNLSYLQPVFVRNPDADIHVLIKCLQAWDLQEENREYEIAAMISLNRKELDQIIVEKQLPITNLHLFKAIAVTHPDQEFINYILSKGAKLELDMLPVLLKKYKNSLDYLPDDHFPDLKIEDITPRMCKQLAYSGKLPGRNLPFNLGEFQVFALKNIRTTFQAFLTTLSLRRDDVVGLLPREVEQLILAHSLGLNM